MTAAERMRARQAASPIAPRPKSHQGGVPEAIAWPLVEISPARLNAGRRSGSRPRMQGRGPLALGIVDIARAEKQDFTQADIDAITAALEKLAGNGNVNAWRHEAATVPEFASVHCTLAACAFARGRMALARPKPQS